MNKLPLLLLGIFIFSFAFVSAENIGTFKQGDTINITNFCQDGGCTGIDLISVTYPDGTSQIINSAMTMNGKEGFYEWSNTTALGTYYFKTTGSNGVTNLDSFEITPSGSSGSENIAFFIIIIVLIYGVTAFGIVRRGEEGMWWVTVLGAMAMMFLGLYLIQNGIIIFRDDLTLYLGYLTLFLGGGISLWVLLDYLRTEF